ncbi:hypothetical protein BU17DRAFT_87605 [Hysterangium stoloniferum]|nr:hypothetical protein BU17DRAFT_87605 [Hysterangium stoloniferum]
MHLLFKFSFISFAIALAAQAVEVTWTLAAKTIAPDSFSRSAALINGQYPGPLLTANKDDSVIVNLKNQLADPLIVSNGC